MPTVLPTHETPGRQYATGGFLFFMQRVGRSADRHQESSMTMTYNNDPTLDWRFNHTLAVLRALTAGVLAQGAPHSPLLRC